MKIGNSEKRGKINNSKQWHFEEKVFYLSGHLSQSEMRNVAFSFRFVIECV